MSYILITPIKDEAETLLKLKETIINQTVKPLIWVIGDGNSKDGSFQSAKELFNDYEWIHVIKQKTFFEKGYSHANFAAGFNDCYKFAKKKCAENNINYSFIGKTDATPVLANNYFEVLIKEMNHDPKLAFTCGLQHIEFMNSKQVLNQLVGISNTGINDIRIYSREFLEEMEGYPMTSSPDTILQIKALNRGWNIKLSEKTYFVETRLGGSKIGVWKGYKLKGRGMYVLGYHPFLMLLNALYFSFRFPPHYQGFAVLFGYFVSIIKNERTIEDPEIREYFKKKRLKEIINQLSKYVGL